MSNKRHNKSLNEMLMAFLLIATATGACASGKSHLSDLVRSMTDEPVPSVSTETYGHLDERKDELIKAVEREPETFRSIYSAGNSYVRANMLFAAAKVGKYKELLLVAIEEYNEGRQWLAALATINQLSPELVTKYDLPTLEERGDHQRPGVSQGMLA